ncbi:MAG: NADP-dependent glyceraldehyde-3-phosphate dehydrogenase [Candidatus Wallbacteria bacterium]|nr:NADP-dependent glyceraldehyde-3-phosphate dehydrogenase [Candidatus Wallbacteria bacterium]
MGVAESIKGIFQKDIPAKFSVKNPVNQTEYLINGEIRQWKGPQKVIYSPVCFETADGAVPREIGSIPLMDESAALEALEFAVAAYNHGKGEWPCLKVEERLRCLEQFTIRMKERRDEIVNLLMWEIGKTYSDSCKEFDRTVEYILATMNAVREMDHAASKLTIEEGIIGQIRRSPLGVVLCMGPFNYPLNETFTTLIPALIMGNTVVFKPAKHGVLFVRQLLEAFRDSFPAGVVNTVYGEGKQVAGPLMATGKVDVLAFIGTSRVADTLKKQHPSPHRLRCILGLDAKNPGIVLENADLELSVKECLLGALSFNGQRCTAIKIVFVHRSLSDRFLSRFSEEIAKLVPGLPWEENVALTPLPEPGKPEYLTELIRDAVSLGARVVNQCGGTVNQTFFYPAVLYPVNHKMRIYSEEQFGPLIPVVPFDDLETPGKYIVESNFGQQVSIFGSDPGQVAGLVDLLTNQVSRVNLNCQCQRGPDSFPFTGRKDSAEGTLSVTDALRVFSIRSLVAAKSTDQNKNLINTILKERKSNFLSTDFIL